MSLLAGQSTYRERVRAARTALEQAKARPCTCQPTWQYTQGCVCARQRAIAHAKEQLHQLVGDA